MVKIHFIRSCSSSSAKNLWPFISILLVSIVRKRQSSIFWSFSAQIILRSYAVRPSLGAFEQFTPYPDTIPNLLASTLTHSSSVPAIVAAMSVSAIRFICRATRSPLKLGFHSQRSILPRVSYSATNVLSDSHAPLLPQVCRGKSAQSVQSARYFTGFHCCTSCSFFSASLTYSPHTP